MNTSASTAVNNETFMRSCRKRAIKGWILIVFHKHNCIIGCYQKLTVLTVFHKIRCNDLIADVAVRKRHQ